MAFGSFFMSILSESKISLCEAAALLPGNRPGKRVSFSTVWRWVMRGVLAADGETRVRLEAVRVGAKWVTSHEAIARFSEALTPDLGGGAATARTPVERKRAASAASKRLEAIGI
jgi:hypothetical protein